MDIEFDKNQMGRDGRKLQKAMSFWLLLLYSLVEVFMLVANISLFEAETTTPIAQNVTVTIFHFPLTWIFFCIFHVKNCSRAFY